jgi:hypothetical protein
MEKIINYGRKRYDGVEQRETSASRTLLRVFPEGKKGRGRPVKRWNDEFQKVCVVQGMN